MKYVSNQFISAAVNISGAISNSNIAPQTGQLLASANSGIISGSGITIVTLNNQQSTLAALTAASGGNFVHLTGNETISGSKTFASAITTSGITNGSSVITLVPSGNISFNNASSIDINGNSDFSSLSLSPDILTISGASMTVIVRGVTVNAGTTVLGIIGSATGISVPINSAISFSVLVSAINTNTIQSESAGFIVNGVIKNITGTVSFQGTPTITVITRPNNNWNATALANNTQKTLEIQVTGQTGRTIRWAAQLTSVLIGI